LTEKRIGASEETALLDLINREPESAKTLLRPFDVL
jgi:hypothetical protein